MGGTTIDGLHERANALATSLRIEDEAHTIEFNMGLVMNEMVREAEHLNYLPNLQRTYTLLAVLSTHEGDRQYYASLLTNCKNTATVMEDMALKRRGVSEFVASRLYKITLDTTEEQKRADRIEMLYQELWRLRKQAAEKWRAYAGLIEENNPKLAQGVRIQADLYDPPQETRAEKID